MIQEHKQHKQQEVRLEFKSLTLNFLIQMIQLNFDRLNFILEFKSLTMLQISN